MNVKIGAEAALFPEKEYINGIAVALWKGIPASLRVGRVNLTVGEGNNRALWAGGDACKPCGQVL